MAKYELTNAEKKETYLWKVTWSSLKQHAGVLTLSYSPSRIRKELTTQTLEMDSDLERLNLELEQDFVHIEKQVRAQLRLYLEPTEVNYVDKAGKQQSAQAPRRIHIIPYQDPRRMELQIEIFPGTSSVPELMPPTPEQLLGKLSHEKASSDWAFFPGAVWDGLKADIEREDRDRSGGGGLNRRDDKIRSLARGTSTGGTSSHVVQVKERKESETSRDFFKS